MVNEPRPELAWLEPTVIQRSTGRRALLTDLDGRIVDRLLAIQQRLWNPPALLKPANLTYRHQTASRIWECAYSFANSRYWDARSFEDPPDFIVTDIDVEFDEPMRQIMPGGGIPLLAAGFYARTFYASASQALKHLSTKPAAFPDIARLAKSDREQHPVTLVRHEIVEHAEYVDRSGRAIDSFGAGHSLAEGIALARGDGPADAGLVANAEQFVATFEAGPEELAT